MNKITSTVLANTQNTLEQIVKNYIDDPMTPYKNLAKFLSIIKDVDKMRRKAWNEEKFGDSDKLAEAVFPSTDDIPF